ncbi:hypothetical protein GCM10027270_19720 [Nocardioides ginkgobilobae]
MTGVRTVQVTFDCADPRGVGEFWQEALGYVTPPVPPGFDSWDDLDASHGRGSTRRCSSNGCMKPTVPRRGSSGRSWTRTPWSGMLDGRHWWPHLGSSARSEA